MAAQEKQAFDVQTISADVLCDFLEVAFHLILYVREVYPAVVFERRKKYNVPVQMCCHPLLNRYIQDILVTIKPLIEKNEVFKISLVISNKSLQPIERFTFEIAQPDNMSISSDDNLLLHTESALRAFLLKINVCDALLKNNPPECTFTVLAHTKESAQVELKSDSKSEEFPWIPEQESTAMKDFNIIPLKSMTSPILKMQMYVEENVDKKKQLMK